MATKTANPTQIQDALDILLAQNLIVAHDDTYTWTEMGKIACPRYADPFPGDSKSPEQWATAMAQNTERHCIVCGRDCYRKWVWEDLGKRCICYTCHTGYTMDDQGNAVRR